MKSEPLKPKNLKPEPETQRPNLNPIVSPKKADNKAPKPDSRKPASKPDLNFNYIPTRHSKSKPKKNPEPLNRCFYYQWKQELNKAIK
jgi:hypothetical protein